MDSDVLMDYMNAEIQSAEKTYKEKENKHYLGLFDSLHPQLREAFSSGKMQAVIDMLKQEVQEPVKLERDNVNWDNFPFHDSKLANQVLKQTAFTQARLRGINEAISMLQSILNITGYEKPVTKIDTNQK